MFLRRSVDRVGDAGELVKIVADGAQFVDEAFRLRVAARAADGGGIGRAAKAKLPDILAEAGPGLCRRGFECGAFGGGQLHPEVDGAPLAGVGLPVPCHGGIPPTWARLITKELAIWLPLPLSTLSDPH